MPIFLAIPHDNKFWQKTKFGELANHYQTAKYKFRQYYFHIIIIIIIISIYVAFLPVRRLFFSAPFPLCIKGEHAAEIFRGTRPITFALFLMATAYGLNALLSSIWHVSPVVSVQMSWYRWKHIHSFPPRVSPSFLYEKNSVVQEMAYLWTTRYAYELYSRQDGMAIY